MTLMPSRAFCILGEHQWTSWSVAPSSKSGSRMIAGRSCRRCDGYEEYTNVNYWCPYCKHPAAVRYGWKNAKWKCRACNTGVRHDTHALDEPLVD